MLHLLLGRAGSGKTTTLRARLHQHAAAGQERLVLLVPEQASFDNERALLRLLGPKAAQNVQVYSFSRLCDALARRYGGGAGRRLDDGGRAILMSQAVEQVKDTLQYYRRSARGTELVPMLLDANAEFKSCGVGAEELRKAATGAEMPMLGEKLNELARILECYDALVRQSWLDPQDDLTRAAACLQQHRFFADALVYIDGFQSFTKQQYGVLRPMLRQAADVTVSLCADSLADPEQGMGVFSIVRQTAAGLIRAAKEEDVRVAPPEVLPCGVRFQSDDLKALEASLYRTEKPAPQPAENVFLYEASDPYDEAAYTAAAVRHLLMEGFCRARDIAIVARDIDSYHGIMDTALDAYEIPYFMDEARDITHEPLMRMILAAFAVVRTGFDSEAVFTYLKTELTDLSPDTTAALENYCFVWHISGRAWHSSFTANPEGFAKAFTDKSKEQLVTLERARKTIVSPLEAFAAATADADGVALAKAAYQLLQDAHVPANLKALAASLERAGQPALADDTLRLWDLLMQVLDQCALVLGTQPVTRSRFEELMRLVLSNSQMASIPQGVDEVTVGAADRIRTEAPKVVFVLDAAKDDFPKTPGTAGVLSFAERLSLIRGGLPLNDTLEGVDVQERFLAYAAVSAPSRRLYLSWPASGTDGAAKLPSSLISQVRETLSGVPLQTAATLPVGWLACSRKAAFAQLARTWRHRTPEEAALRELFSADADAPRVSALERAAVRAPQQFADAACAQELFHRDMRLSASQAEVYALCPFQYFCRYGLQARERRAAELDPMEYGSLMHYLLEHLFRDTGAKKLHSMEQAQLQELIHSLLQTYVKENLGVSGEKEPRFAFLLGRVAAAAAVVAAHIAEELCQSNFKPVNFELPIGQQPDGVPGLRLPLEDGGSVELIGKVDRVDVWDNEVDQTKWLRVVDYKTGKKKFRVSDVLYGMNMQMLLYLAALYENGAPQQKLKPAGVLYMPAAVPAASVDRRMPAEKQLQKQEAELCMSGLVRDDPAIVRAMEEEAAGRYLPVKLKNGEPDGKGSAVSGPELEALLAYVQNRIREMAQQLHKGAVQASPLVGKGYDACAWCPYAPVCGREQDDPVREMNPPKPEEALQMISKGGKPE
ncbi:MULTISPECIES: PD-(D/E)XK nuclease family protein [Caproicibacterium]|uniref:PD-(D/E)XK nuclease family protein n=1 Tax=Caproicibacterium argilliputei TaxID=3030016 RepID=A0AA97H336_9FIRM|nr:PD-(D/E)XK nuclease family protein [Caproicibacterium argilliputei]WOC33405.1 PD-(D/E)XK nuclease family protein [Caproicibacterium argilliputei]